MEAKCILLQDFFHSSLHPQIPKTTVAYAGFLHMQLIVEGGEFPQITRFSPVPAQNTA